MIYLSEQQKSFQEVAENFAITEIGPNAPFWDQESIFPIDTLRKGAELGFAGIYIKDDVGGCNLGRLDATLIFEKLAMACPSTAAFFSIHNMVARIIDQFGNQEQRQKWLPDLCNMKKLGSYCLTEPNSGSDAASLQTKAKKLGDYYIINGTKAFISGGGVSDIYACMVRTGDNTTDGISCIIVPKDAPGLSFGKKEQKMGWRNQPTTIVNFTDCKIPISNLIGKEGQGFKIAMKALDGGRVNIASCSLGGAQECLNRTLNYLNERKQFGRKLNNFQALQFRIADMVTDLEAARLMVHNAAIKIDNNANDATKWAAMAKKLATDNGFNIVNQALQLHGGYGYLQEYNIERYLRDLRVHQILEGTNEIMRLIITKHTISK